MTGLSLASAGNVVRELLDDGILIEAGSADSDGGRRRGLLRMAPEYGYVIGVDIGETRVDVELFDLAMTVRAKAVYRLDPGEREVSVVVERILAGLDAVLADCGVAAEAVIGVGVGVPGIVEEGPEATGSLPGLRLGRGPARAATAGRHRPAAAVRELRENHGAG